MHVLPILSGFDKHVNQVHKVGFDFHDRDSLDTIMPGAKIYLGEAPSDPTSAYYFELDKKEIEDRYHQTKTVTNFVNDILKDHEIEVDQDSEEFKSICKQALEMLYRLDERKREFRNDL